MTGSHGRQDSEHGQRMLARCARCGRKLPRKGAEHVAGAGVLCRRCAVKVTGADAGEVRQ